MRNPQHSVYLLIAVGIVLCLVALLFNLPLKYTLMGMGAALLATACGLSILLHGINDELVILYSKISALERTVAQQNEKLKDLM